MLVYFSGRRGRAVRGLMSGRGPLLPLRDFLIKSRSWPAYSSCPVSLSLWKLPASKMKVYLLFLVSRLPLECQLHRPDPSLSCACCICLPSACCLFSRSSTRDFSLDAHFTGEQTEVRAAAPHNSQAAPLFSPLKPSPWSHTGPTKWGAQESQLQGHLQTQKCAGEAWPWL